jgi:Kef-type K+ transport system membrane component KefB
MSHNDPITSVLLWITLIFIFGVFGRFCAMRLSQPAVLGELLMGVIVGNVCYFSGLDLAVILREGPSVFNVIRDMLAGIPLNPAVMNSIHNPLYAKEVIQALSSAQGVDLIKIAYVADIFSRYGVIFLLFMVGLESSLAELKSTGRDSLQVAVLGIVMPIIFGLVATYFLMPSASFNAHLFVAATLCATSIGITARVLKEMKLLKTREARTILGAAMIDDILGLVILAIVTSLILNGEVQLTAVCQMIVLALFFFVSSLMLGPWLIRKAVRIFSFMSPWEAKLTIAFIFVMGLSWFAALLHLATIIGAFAAGILIHDGFFEQQDSKHHLKIKELIAPFEALLAPLFFMLIGIQVKIEAFLDLNVLMIALGLIIAAVLGKLIAGIGATASEDKLFVGIGMLPRGEVGLVFASIGKTLGVMSDHLFFAIVLMVVLTTMIAPIWLKIRAKRHAT